MKTMNFILAAILSAILIKASQAQSEFVLQLNPNMNYLIYWDNNSFNHQGGNFVLSNVYEGMHELEIYTYKKSLQPTGISHFQYLLFNGKIYIPPFTRTIAIIHPNGVLQKIKEESLCFYDNNTFNNYPKPMHPVAFQNLVEVLDDANFDSNRLQIAEQAARNNYFSAHQIATIVDLFNFESNKVKFAKQAYHACVDPENFFLVYKHFSFSSSVNELNRYIEQNQYR